MRVGLFCDVAGEPKVLEAALMAFEWEGCERLVCLGNLVSARGDFSESARVLARARGAGVLHLAGPAEHEREADLALDAELRLHLAALPAVVREGGAVFCRGSPLRPEKARAVAGGFDAALALRRLAAVAAFHAAPLPGAYLGRNAPARFRSAATPLSLERSPALVAVGSLASEVKTVAIFDAATLRVRWRALGRSGGRSVGRGLGRAA